MDAQCTSDILGHATIWSSTMIVFRLNYTALVKVACQFDVSLQFSTCDSTRDRRDIFPLTLFRFFPPYSTGRRMLPVLASLKYGKAYPIA